MKKIIVLIVTIIIALILALIALLNMIKNGEVNTVINQNSIEPPSNITESTSPEYKENLRLAPRNIRIAMHNYQGLLTQGDLEKNLYNLVVNHIPYLYNQIKTYTEAQLGQYYDQRKGEINNMNIYSKDEFILICKDIQNNITEQNKLEMPVSIIELTTCEDTVDNYSFELILKYSDINIIRLKTILSKTEEKIEYQKYDELKDIFLKYDGLVTKQEITKQLNIIAGNAKTVYDSCKELPLNKILQYYDLNKTELVKLGVYSRNDYLNLTNQIVRITWLQNPKYIGFTADATTLKSNDTYTSFKVNINYSTEESIKVTVNVINAKELINDNNPKIKITAEMEKSE